MKPKLHNRGCGYILHNFGYVFYFSEFKKNCFKYFAEQICIGGVDEAKKYLADGTFTIERGRVLRGWPSPKYRNASCIAALKAREAGR